MNQVVELSIKDFLIAILHQWKKVLAVALLLAIVVGGLSLYRASRGENTVNPVAEARVQAHNKNLAYRKANLAFYTQRLNEAVKNSEHSLLMQVDPYNVPTAVLDLAVKMDETALLVGARTGEVVDPKLASSDYIPKSNLLLSTPALQVLNRYRAIAANAALSQIFSSVLGSEVSDQNLRDIVVVEQDDAGVLTIKVSGTDKVDPQPLADAMLAYLQGKQDEVVKGSYAHELVVVNRSLVHQQDDKLAKLQDEQRKLVTEYSSQVDKAVSEIQELEKRKVTMPSPMDAVPTNALMGFVGGLVIGVLWAVVSYAVKLPVQTPEYLSKKLGIRYLGGRRFRKGVFLGQLGDKLAGDLSLAEGAGALELVGANLAGFVNDGQKILVTGTLPVNELAPFAENMTKQFAGRNISFVAGGDINSNATTIRLLGEVDSVLLVERLSKSGLKAVMREKERVDLSDKPVVGYALY